MHEMLSDYRKHLHKNARRTLGILGHTAERVLTGEDDASSESEADTPRARFDQLGRFELEQELAKLDDEQLAALEKPHVEPPGRATVERVVAILEKESVVPPLAIVTDARCQWNMPLPPLKRDDLQLSEHMVEADVPKEDNTRAETDNLSDPVPLSGVSVPLDDATVKLSETLLHRGSSLEGQTLPHGMAFPPSEASPQHEHSVSRVFAEREVLSSETLAGCQALLQSRSLSEIEPLST